MTKVGKLWGGRFDTLPSQEIIDFLSGRDVRAVPACDERLIPYDLWGSRAHVVMLCRRRILSKQDGKKILSGLKDIQTLYEKGKFRLDPSKEDVHSNVESLLIERVGIESGGKVHTGRSRNDQICLDMRLYLRDQVVRSVTGLVDLMDVLLQRAREHAATVMPGYTHHQHAMVTTFGHLLLGFCEGFHRDVQRLMHWFVLFNKNPLGAAAGYGTSFPLDRQMTSKLLGFDGPTENTADPITQRWEPEAEFAYALAVMMDHLSTVAQTFILLSSSEFKMVRLSDRHCSGSSMMPQKRNPDTLEVIKGRASFAHGIVSSLLSAGKGLFAGYNRDTQWTKYWIMDLVDETGPSLPVMAEVVRRMEVDEARMLEQARSDFVGATSLMEWMVFSRGLPLRKAKSVVERAVKYAEREGLEEISLSSLEKSLREMKIEMPIREPWVQKFQDPRSIVARYGSIGMPSEKGLREEMASLQERLAAHREWIRMKRKEMERAKEMLSRMEREWIG